MGIWDRRDSERIIKYKKVEIEAGEAMCV